jgi:cytochrome c assembly protein
MHELEQRIRQWRREVARQLDGRREVIDELESHLREELQRALAPAIDQAWTAALAKLGDPKMLEAEFAKLTPPTGWLPARLVGLGWIGIVAMVLVLAPVAILSARGDPLLVVHVSFVLLGYLATLLVGTLGICFAVARAFSDWHVGRSRSFRRIAFALTLFATGCTAVGVWLGMQWAQRAWAVAWAWDPKEVGALAVIAGNLALAGLLLWPWVSDRLTMAISLLNNMIVCLAWFHPLLGIVGRPGLHSYGWSRFAPLLIAALVLQALFMIVAAAPAGWLRKQQTS